MDKAQQSTEVKPVDKETLQATPKQTNLLIPVISQLLTNSAMLSAWLCNNYGFGSGVVTPGTGILLNDEMDDFAAVWYLNAYGLVGGDKPRP